MKNYKAATQKVIWCETKTQKLMHTIIFVFWILRFTLNDDIGSFEKDRTPNFNRIDLPDHHYKDIHR